MAKKIGKGKVIEELVKGSLEYTLAWIQSQFRRQFPYVDNGPNFYVVDSFVDYVVVETYNSELMPSEFYQVTYTRNGDQFTFAARDQWEVIELGYQPKTTAKMLAVSEGQKSEGRKQKSGKRFEEAIEPSKVQLLEAKDEKKGTRRIRINDLVVANEVNGNKRLYDADVVEAMVADWRSHLHESAGQGRLKILTGEVEHPTYKGKKHMEYLETVVRWDNLDWNGERLNIEGDLILTSKGKDVEILMAAGVNPGGSIRGIGESK